MIASTFRLPIVVLMYFLSFQLGISSAFVAIPTALLYQTVPTYIEGKRKKEFDLNSKFIPDADDTIRVRIWRALSSKFGEEVSLKELGAMVGERRMGELRSHLQHVEKQSRTLRNKSAEWKERRGLTGTKFERDSKIRIQIRRGKKNMLSIKLC
ncbi:unnamed protein product [Pseudo-nitzschia multistriata]|uniref:Uncharacterized protein n=1 Tax=Pseudo-nitzschia multistriata TaxID=183589 RepID=A0A448ZKY7_9STRA|nr:unnamed protein product [Pseudo-nitzschia multistriata]